jgi:hypothetical protein
MEYIFKKVIVLEPTLPLGWEGNDFVSGELTLMEVAFTRAVR